MASAVASTVPSLPHAPELSRADRLWMLEAMAASRSRRLQVAEDRRRGRMAQLEGAATAGWEGLEAAASRALRDGDALAASAEWLTPMAGARRVGAACRLTDMVAAGLGATFGAAPGTIVIALTGPEWGASESAALATAVRRRAPLVVMVAAPGATADAARTAAGSAGSVFELVNAAEVDVISLAVQTACMAARAGQGPTTLAFRPATPGRPRKRWEPHEPSADPIERYAARLGQLGVSVAEMREVARSAVAKG